MCGRYTFIPGEGWVNKYKLKGEQQLKDYATPNYNVAPMQTMPIVTAEGLKLMKWGLVPSWSKEFKPMFTSINARAESVAEKPLYRTPFKKRRCLVPASGFYEWQKRADSKQPFYFHLTNREMFNFAGLYDIWYDADKQPFYSYTIITTEPNGTMADVHDRMPVILDPDEEKHWLDENEAPEQLQLLLDPYVDNVMEKYEVSSEVGNVRNNFLNLLNKNGSSSSD